jgi:hypothetical protein
LWGRRWKLEGFQPPSTFQEATKMRGFPLQEKEAAEAARDDLDDPPPYRVQEEAMTDIVAKLRGKDGVYLPHRQSLGGHPSVPFAGIAKEDGASRFWRAVKPDRTAQKGRGRWGWGPQRPRN